jgi:hypothetical protein
VLNLTIYIYINTHRGLKELNFLCISGTSKSQLHSNTLFYGVTDWFIRSRPRINNYKSRERSLVCTYIREYKVGWATEDAKIRFNPFEGTCGHGALCSDDVAANMAGGTVAISVVKCLLGPKFRRVCNTLLFNIFHNKKASRVTSGHRDGQKKSFRYNYLHGL